MLKNIPRRAGRVCPRLQRLRLWLAKLCTREAVWLAASWLSGAMLMAPASLATLFRQLNPFAPALFSAGLIAGVPPISMLMGCAIAIPMGEFSPDKLLPALACLTSWGAALLQKILLKEESENREFSVAVSSGIGALLPGLIIANGTLSGILTACVGAIAAGALGPCLLPILQVRRGRTSLLPDEMLSAAAHIALFMLGCSFLPGFFRHAPIFVAAFAALLCADSGAGWGALGGMTAGLVLRLCGFDPLFCALFALPGALAGGLSVLSKYSCALGMLLGTAIIGTWCFGAMLILPEIVCATAAGVAFCLLPENARTFVRRNFSTGREDEAHAVDRLRANLQRDMHALADVFSELADGYAHSPSAMPGEADMVARLRGKLCENCPSYASCWSGADSTANRLLCQLLGLAFSGMIPEDNELPPEIGRQCRRAAQIPRRIGPLLSDFEARRRTEMKRTRLTALMSGQFAQAKQLLERAGGAIALGARTDAQLASVARCALEKQNLRAEYVFATQGDSPEICAKLAEKPQGAGQIKRAMREMGAEMGMPLCYALTPNLDLRFTPQPRFQIRTGWKSLPGAQNCPSGDSRIALRLHDGRMLLALSDGMGSGERAERESAQTLQLIARFLQAGVEPCAAIDAINELMLLRSGEDMFSTVDLCLINAAGSCAEFIKLGACRSYLLRSGACVRLEGGRLPLGILEEVRPVRRTLPLHKGDLIVMASDGLECGDEDEWVSQLLYEMREAEPQKIADALTAQAKARNQTHTDDITVICFRVQ